MRTPRMWVWGLGFVGLFGSITFGGEISLLPISASGPHTIAGNEIILDGDGQRIFLEIFVSDWDPGLIGLPELRTYQAKIDSAGYTSGLLGTLMPWNPPCPANIACTVDADCALGDCDNRVSCPNGDEDCAPPAVPSTTTCENGICLNSGNCQDAGDAQCEAIMQSEASTCNEPPGAGVRCKAGFIDDSRGDYVFTGMTDIAAVDTATLNYTFGATVNNTPYAEDLGVAQYGGTLVLDVPVGAVGTFTVDLIADSSFLKNPNGIDIVPLDLSPALITIACQGNTDCNDNNACTDDDCLPDRTCSNIPNFDPAFCCAPANGDLTLIDDEKECTNDVCDPDTGIVTHPPVAEGTPCGDPYDDECNLADTCDGAGSCEDNVEPAGTPCGDPTSSDCDDPDECDGTGTCDPNHVPALTPCGDTADTDCTDPDTCDGSRTCLPNHAPDATPCDDGLFCNENEACASGLCSGGTAVDCDDGLPCTTDSCNEETDQCDNDLDTEHCLITEICRADGELNPVNDCEACDPAEATTDWSFLSAGTQCDDGDPCTGTGRPGIGFDECDGAGTCAGAVDPECNDDCEFAIEAFEGTNTSNNDNGGPDDAEALCQPNSNNDVWFIYTPTCDGAVSVTTTGSQFAPSNDPVLSVFDACPDVGGVEIACDDDSGVALQAALTFTATSGQPYWIRVAGFEDNSGDIVLNIGTVDDCLIDGVCYAADTLNPVNDCEACIPEVSTTSWSPLAEGEACGDGNDDECDSPDACDGAGVCEPNPKPDGTACTDEGNDCTVDICLAGVCSHPPTDPGTPCGDPSDSTCDHPNTCDGAAGCLPNYEPPGTSCGDPSDDQCDRPDICDGAGVCDDNLEPDGTECDDADVCTGDDVCETGVCVGTPIPQAPDVDGVGSRRLAVTPLPAGSPAPVALRLTSPDWPCVDAYITPGGSLTSTPIFQLPDDWGTVVVSHPDIVPSSLYHVVAECGTFVSPIGSGMTALWGDVAGEWVGTEWAPPDGDVDFDDITATVDAFRVLPGAPPTEVVDLAPCTPDLVIDFDDIVAVVDAFRGLPFPCVIPCP